LSDNINARLIDSRRPRNIPGRTHENDPWQPGREIAFAMHQVVKELN
jgi:hypothetical protein